MKNFQNAKLLFQKYKYSHFHMSRECESDYKKYLSYNISKEQERLWIKELLETLKSQLNYENNNRKITKLVEDISYYARILTDESSFFELCNYLMKAYNRLDTNTIVRCSFAILDLYNSFRYKNRINEQYYYLLIKILEILKNESLITISKDYMVNNNFPDYLTKERVKTNLENVIKGYVNVLKHCNLL